jgi:hypothetical protein
LEKLESRVDLNKHKIISIEEMTNLKRALPFSRIMEQNLEEMKLKSSSGLIWISFFCIAAVIQNTSVPVEANSKTAANASKDVLPSWNDCPAKTAILDHVAAVTDGSSPSYVPPEERIAVCDNDGTLCCERPSQFMFLFMQDRVKDLAPMHPEWLNEEPFSSILSGMILSQSNFNAKEVLDVYATTCANMTVDEYAGLIRS